MKNAHISAFLDYYISLNNAPNYAVLIKGQWGSGKSWFIKNYIEADKSNKYLVVSLYGIEKLEDINDEFYRQLNPILSSKSVKLAGALLKGILKTTIKVDLDLINKDSKNDTAFTAKLSDIEIPKFLQNLNQQILVFDDLERCTLPLANVLGFINQLVENNDLKAIIIANEEEIKKQNISLSKKTSTSEKGNTYSEYNLIKEKLIGKTFTIEVDLDSAIEQFLKHLDSSNVKSLIQEYVNTIKEIFAIADYNNLRHLKQTFLDFERFVSFLPSDSLQKKDLCKKIIEIFFSISFELKRGVFKVENIADIFDIITYLKTASPSYTQEVSKKYGFFDRHFNPINSQIWTSYFMNSIVNHDALEESLHNSIYYEIDNMPDWQKLRNFWRLNDEDFNILYAKVYKDLVDKNISDKRTLLRIIDMLLFFSKNNVITLQQETIKDLAITNVGNMKEAGIIRFELGSKFPIDNNIGFDYLDLENIHFQDVRSYIEKTIEITKKETFINMSKELISLLERSIDDFESLMIVNNFGTSQFHQIPILAYVNKNDFRSVFWKLSSISKRHLGNIIHQRYNHKDFNKLLKEELQWLKEIRELIKDENDSNLNLLQKYLVNEGFIKYIDLAIQSLSS